VLSVLTFWLFAQSVINVVPAMKSSLDISLRR
jgi:DHA2 family multidrug resistance protein-like MFS transporter